MEDNQIALLKRVAQMLSYIELLGRALTPKEVKKVHALLVDIESEQAKQRQG